MALVPQDVKGSSKVQMTTQQHRKTKLSIYQQDKQTQRIITDFYQKVQLEQHFPTNNEPYDDEYELSKRMERLHIMPTTINAPKTEATQEADTANVEMWRQIIQEEKHRNIRTVVDQREAIAIQNVNGFTESKSITLTGVDNIDTLHSYNKDNIGRWLAAWKQKLGDYQTGIICIQETHMVSLEKCEKIEAKWSNIWGFKSRQRKHSFWSVDKSKKRRCRHLIKPTHQGKLQTV